MKSSKIIKYLTTFIFEFIAIFICFFSFYYPLKDFAPYSKNFSILKDDYIYTLNEDYSSYYDDLSDVSYYHYEYEGEGATLYLNRNALNDGIIVLAEAPYLSMYTFKVFNPAALKDGVKYDLTDNSIISNRIFKTSFGIVNLDATQLIIDDKVNEKFVCEYKVYPPDDSGYIRDAIIFEEGTFSARGRTIKNSIFSSKNTIGTILMLIALVPSTLLFIVMSFYYSLLIDKESKKIFVNHLFYEKKNKIIFNEFIKYFSRLVAFSIISAFINYFLFLATNPLLLILPIVLFSFVEFIYLLTFIKKKINNLLEEGVNIKYVD